MFKYANLLVIFWFAFLYYYIYQSIHINQPTIEHKIISYFEESGDDLKYIYCSLLKKAKKSIHLASFGFSDPDIKKIIEKKRLEGILITDFNSSIEKKTRKKISGLYHKKFLVIDEKELYIGSANLTKASLSFQGNQMFGLLDKELISLFLKGQCFENDFITLFSLPHQAKDALDRLLNHLMEAKSRIIISMYALTHPKIIDQIINAHKRGLFVEIFLDESMIKGSCKKAMSRLQEANIALYTRAKGGLNHHKCALIDNTYILGSTNWSQAGFTKNEETFLIIPNLSKDLLNSIEMFLKKSKYYCKKLI